MIELQDVIETLENLGIPTAYRVFHSAVKLPYCVYYADGYSNLSADGIVYNTNLKIAIELYTENKDIKMEEKLEKALSSFFYTKTEIYIDDEKMYMIKYEI